MEMETVKAESLSPLKFWSDFISKRQPVLIDGHLQEDHWKVSETWNLEYLREKAGQCKVFVEYRHSRGEAFGKGNRRKIQFSEFLDQLESGSEKLYLTPQPTTVGDDGFSEILSPLLTHLSEDFGLRPKLLGHLIPHQLNLWLGSSEKGAMSGLHHDYHDNLYVLLKGQKQFLLFPPETASIMYTHGEIEYLHKNGRIVYKGQGDVLADGSDAYDVAQWKRQKHKQKKTEQNDDLSSDEADLEAALCAFENERDDYEQSSESSDDSSNHEHQNKKQKKNIAQEEVEEPDPPSFSQIDLAMPDDVLKEQYPLFPGRSSAIECTVNEGQMLYLPAGWFHNVTSLGKDIETNIHMALNYWCYPPDNINHNNKEDARNAFEQPYCSDYWNETQSRKFS